MGSGLAGAHQHNKRMCVRNQVQIGGLRWRSGTPSGGGGVGQSPLTYICVETRSSWSTSGPTLGDYTFMDATRERRVAEVGGAARAPDGAGGITELRRVWPLYKYLKTGITVGADRFSKHRRLVTKTTRRDKNVFFLGGGSPRQPTVRKSCRGRRLGPRCLAPQLQGEQNVFHKVKLNTSAWKLYTPARPIRGRAADLIRRARNNALHARETAARLLSVNVCVKIPDKLVLCLFLCSNYPRRGVNK